MATGINGLSDIDNAVKPMLAESRYTLEHTPIMKGLFRTERLPKGQGSDYRYPKYGQISASALANGVDLIQGQKLQDTLATITPTEVGIKVLMIERLMDVVRDDMMRLAGRLMGDAMARLLDTDGITMLDGFSVQLGGAGTALTWEFVAAAESAIAGGTSSLTTGVGEPAPASAPIYGVFHPHQLHPLAKDFAPAGTYPVPDGLSNDIMKSGFNWQSVAGVKVHRDGNIPKDTNDDAKGGVFSKEAVILVMDDMPGIKKDEDISLRAIELVQTWWYAYGEYKDDWGREMFFDAVTPTS